MTAKPKVMENEKKSWKKSWKVMEFEELKRVRTLTELGLSLHVLTFDRLTMEQSLLLCFKCVLYWLTDIGPVYLYSC